MSLIRVDDLTKTFERSGTKFDAIKNLDLTINDGEFVHVVGRSGSGKSTLLNLISGILKPTSGNVYVEDRLLNEMDDNQKSEIRNSVIGFVPQMLGTLPNLTVIDNVRLPYFFKQRDGDGLDRAAMLLDMLGILHLKDDFCNRLSGGELKRVMIARALMNEAKILIADEPTADLDTETTSELMDLLVKLNSKGIAMLIVTHEMDVLKYGNIVYEMKDGILYNKAG